MTTHGKIHTVNALENGQQACLDCGCVVVAFESAWPEGDNGFPPGFVTVRGHVTAAGILEGAEHCTAIA